MPGITSMRGSVKAELKDERENRDNTVTEQVYEKDINASLIEIINLKKKNKSIKKH